MFGEGVQHRVGDNVVRVGERVLIDMTQLVREYPPDAQVSPARVSAEDRSIWPWQVEPYRLWSWLDMLRLFGAAFINSVVNLQSVMALVTIDDPEIDLNTEVKVKMAITDFVEECEKHHPQFLDDVVNQAKRVLTRLDGPHDRHYVMSCSLSYSRIFNITCPDGYSSQFRQNGNRSI
jgi:hypothetical protein